MKSYLRYLRFFGIGLILGLAQLACGVESASPASEASAEATIPQSGPTRQASLPDKTQVPPQPAVAESRMLTVEFPPQIRAGDSDIVRLTLEVDEHGNLTPTAEIDGNVTKGEIIQIPNVYDTHNVVAEARLDLAGMQVNPPGSASQTLRPGQKLDFFWSIRADEVGTYRGTLWFFLRFVPLDGGPEVEQALSAQRIEIEAVNFFGLKAQPVRWLGAIGTVLSSVLGLPFLEGILKWLWRRIRS